MTWYVSYMPYGRDISGRKAYYVRLSSESQSHPAATLKEFLDVLKTAQGSQCNCWYKHSLCLRLSHTELFDGILMGHGIPRIRAQSNKHILITLT